jgi:GNAT superfamily N-acetyltransferase
MVGWAGIHFSDTNYQGKKVKLGGYVICTHPDWQGKGVEARLSELALDYIKYKKCDVVFVSVDPSNQPAIMLHHRNGFSMLSNNFSWTNSKGELKEDVGGMIAPANSQVLYDFILNGSEVLHVGNGYW